MERTLEQYEAEYQKLKAESAAWQEKHAAAEARLAELAPNTMLQQYHEEIEQAKARADAAKAELRELNRNEGLRMAAAKLGIHDFGAALKLLDTDALQVNQETGEPTNAETVLGALIHERPYLAAPVVPPSPANPAANRFGLTMAHIGAMGPEEINARWPEVQAVLSRQ